MFKYLKKGHRGLIFIGKYRGKKAIKKSKNPKTKAINRIENEAGFLKKLEKYKIAPKLYKKTKNYIIIEYIEGKTISEYLKKPKNSKKIIKEILKISRLLDKLKIDKKEMSNPYKHILINKRRSIFIDFERTKYSEKPKNLTGICQYLSTKIKINKIKLKDLLKGYKKTYSEKTFKEILKLFT